MNYINLDIIKQSYKLDYREMKNILEDNHIRLYFDQSGEELLSQEQVLELENILGDSHIIFEDY